MHKYTRNAIFASAFAAFALATVPLASAAETKNRNNECPAGEVNCDTNAGMPDNKQFRKRMKENRVDRRNGVYDDNPLRSDRRRYAGNDFGWNYDRDRHDRQRNKNLQFRFLFNGFYYPQQYWLGFNVGAGDRISCQEGRQIVAESGYRRVRTIECSGRTYTYTARRSGDWYRFLVNSRTGDIVSRRSI